MKVHEIYHFIFTDEMVDFPKGNVIFGVVNYGSLLKIWYECNRFFLTLTGRYFANRVEHLDSEGADALSDHLALFLACRNFEYFRSRQAFDSAVRQRLVREAS